MEPVGLSFLIKKKRSKTETFLKRLRTFSAQVRIYRWMQREIREEEPEGVKDHEG